MAPPGVPYSSAVKKSVSSARFSWHVLTWGSPWAQVDLIHNPPLVSSPNPHMPPSLLARHTVTDMKPSLYRSVWGSDTSSITVSPPVKVEKVLQLSDDSKRIKLFYFCQFAQKQQMSSREDSCYCYQAACLTFEISTLKQHYVTFCFKISASESCWWCSVF